MKIFLSFALGWIAGILCAIIWLFTVTGAHAADPNKLVWGGGDPAASAYSGVYVPRIIDVLGQNALTGYSWGGVSAGTLDNAIKVTKAPTNLAVGQWDILSSLKGTPMPDGSGNFAFTVLAQNIGPECLYMVTKQQGYNTWGDVVGNAWQIDLATDDVLSGSMGTWKVLAGVYPDLATLDRPVDNLKGAAAVIDAVISGKDTHGFFVQRPDPNSDLFKKIADNKLIFVPIIDFDLQDKYDFESLKVAYGGLFGQDQYVETACTSVALITGDPAAVPAGSSLSKRLAATIDRIQKVKADDLKPNLATWQDMWGSIKSVAGDDAKNLMDASKKALDDLAKRNAKG